MSTRSNPRGRPILCYVTDLRTLTASRSRSQLTASRAPFHTPRPSLPASHEPLLRTIEAAAHAGVDWIQLRENDLSARACAALTREALLLVQQFSSGLAHPPRILVNDRLDVALAGGAGGVHLREDSLPVEEAKRLLLDSSAAHPLPTDFLVGVSCHSLAAAKAAANAGADYIFFGPVFATPSKAAYGAPQGLDRLAEICLAVSVPVLAIGGINLQNAATCFDAGASGFAAIRLFQDAPDLSTLVHALREL